MNEYRVWTQSVHASEELKRRVLREAEEQKCPAMRSAGKWAACTACLLALVLGLAWGGRETAAPEAPAAKPAALAAESAEPGANGGLVFLDAPAELAGTAVELSEGRRYRLTEEGLRAFVNEDGSRVLVPALAGEEPELTALYAAPEDSRWLLWPVTGSRTVSLSFPYGLRDTPTGGHFHSGIDIPAERGTAIAAAAAGTVVETGFDSSLGNYLVIDHGDGLTTTYGQCQTLMAAAGDTVEPGDTVALLGATGMATGPHLHFEVRQDGEAQNPVAYFGAHTRAQLQAE